MHAVAPCDSIYKKHKAGFRRGGRAVTAVAITGTDSGPSAAHHSFVYRSISALLNTRPSPGTQALTASQLCHRRPVAGNTGNTGLQPPAV